MPDLQEYLPLHRMGDPRLGFDYGYLREVAPPADGKSAEPGGGISASTDDPGTATAYSG